MGWSYGINANGSRKPRGQRYRSKWPRQNVPRDESASRTEQDAVEKDGNEKREDTGFPACDDSGS